MKEFKIKIAYLFFSILLSGNCIAQTIVVQHNNVLEGKMKIAGHYGDNIFVERELNASDNGKCIFFFDSLVSGIYYIVMPDSSSYEIMYDSDYPGKITIDQLKDNTFKVLAAPKPTLKYDEFVRNFERSKNTLDSIRLVLIQHDVKSKEKKKLLEERDILHKKNDELINAIGFEYEGSILGAYIKALGKIDVPEYIPPSNISNKDSAIWVWRLEYYNKHFLDKLDLSDERLVRTPIYTTMINNYLDKITQQQPDKLKSSIDIILNRASKTTATSMFLTDYLLNKYNSLKNSAVYEVVYLHIIEKFYINGESSWVVDSDKTALIREYNSRKPLEMGQKAPDIIMKNLLRTDTSLYMINANYTILYFYNYDCEICRKTSPELFRISQKYSTEFVNVFAVCMGDNNTKCKDYIKKNDFMSWVNVYESEKTNNVAHRYNLSYTPTLFLLDKDKNIVSKNLNTSQLKEILEQYASY